MPPVFAFGLDLEALLAQAGDRRLEVGGDEGEVAGGGDGRLFLGHQVDLGAAALEPGVLAQRRRRLDPLEPDQLEEAGSGLDLRGRDLDSDVVKHGQEFTEVAHWCMFLSATVEPMEAAVAEREAAMTEWNDGRLDELSHRMDDGFKDVNKRIDRVDDNLRYLGERFDAMQRTLMQVGSGILVALIGLIATLIGLIATQV